MPPKRLAASSTDNRFSKEASFQEDKDGTSLDKREHVTAK